jgi:site-specific DNA recombinase
MRKGYTRRTDVRSKQPTRGLWQMATEPGPEFRWGVITRRSKFNADGTEGSTRRQEQELRRSISQNSMGRVVACYSDVASAYDESAHRPEFENALQDLKAGRIDGIAVWKVDRLVRRARQYRDVLDVLEASGGRLFSLVEGIDTAAEGVPKVITNIVLNILVALAEMESDNTSVRVALMHMDRARQGLPHRNSMRPFGHDESWFALVPEEVEYIHEAARRVLAGERINAIARDWTRRGVRTPRGATRWGPDTLKCILTSPRMVAQREYGETLFELEDVPPIMERDLWERLCDKLKNRTEYSPAVSRLASGILHCGATCGLPLVGDRDRRGLPTYKCRKRRHERSACGGVEALCGPVDAVVGEQLVEFLNDRERVGALLRQHASGPEMEALHERIAELNDSLTALDAALNPPAGKPRMPLPRYWAQVESIEAERESITRRLAVTREASILAEALSVEWTEEEWTGRPLEWRRAILRLCVERMELEPRGQGKGREGPAVFDPERVRVKFSA